MVLAECCAPKCLPAERRAIEVIWPSPRQGVCRERTWPRHRRRVGSLRAEARAAADAVCTPSGAAINWRILIPDISDSRGGTRSAPCWATAVSERPTAPTIASSNDRVAVKVLADRYADDAAFRERFMAATAAAGRLIHPNIVTVLDAGIVDGRPFVVMEMVEGPSLRARLSRGTVPIADCQRLASQLADALTAAHRQRIIHGDIRPENVLIDEHGCNAKLSDFGFDAGGRRHRRDAARHRPASGLQPARSRHPRHQRRARRRVQPCRRHLRDADPAPPHAPVADTRTRTRLGQGAPVPVRRHRPDVPPHLDRALWKALEPDPHERIGSAEELRAALSDRNAMAAAAPTPPVLPAASRRSEPRQRRRSGPGAGGLFSAMIPFLATLALIGVAIGGVTIFIPRLFSGFQITDVPPLTGRHTMAEAQSIADARAASP